MAEHPRPSPLALAVLSLLMVGPLHPYGMQRLIKLWGKDQVVNVGQRANLYRTIRRLDRAGLVAVRQSERDQLYPERTVYELTPAGGRTAREWLGAMLSTPRNEFPEFPAALSFASLLGPEGAAAALEARAAALERALEELDGELAALRPTLPRVTLLESEYQRAVLLAEGQWVRGVVLELRTGALGWTLEDFASAGPTYQELMGRAPAPDSPAGVTDRRRKGGGS